MAIEHKHILINAKIMDPLDTYQAAIDFLDDLVESIGMKKLMGPLAAYVNTPGNQGVTAIVGIETSHIAFHIWDEEMPARLQFDLYTCSTLSAETVIRNLVENFGLHNYVHMVLERSEGFNVVSSDTSVYVESEFPQDTLPF